MYYDYCVISHYLHANISKHRIFVILNQANFVTSTKNFSYERKFWEYHKISWREIIFKIYF
eukprot:TRINITY_DN14504_c0_g1_i1.p1 TRINITY_DN14504_c0_g1~~TRINITY_DN14504_c0_g1_i1.p1  ORF type:complete len:61 (-),score=0.35 TRINITY_DN14504_c0_g1_i1:28-210(-)